VTFGIWTLAFCGVTLRASTEFSDEILQVAIPRFLAIGFNVYLR
jgi:hypothetical protein